MTEETKYTSRRLRSSYISSVVSISLILFTLGLLGLLVLDARKISDYVKEHIQLVVFLNEITPVEASGVQSLLEYTDSRTMLLISAKAIMNSRLAYDSPSTAASRLDVKVPNRSFDGGRLV